eukprot:GILJ01008665.1.p1 GENE.GILJ01008665.1~~GILJ01008665.1.p1  ORF type:complete len:400 (-),score=45.49 GILJ01008665.1:117-1316(-)
MEATKDTTSTQLPSISVPAEQVSSLSPLGPFLLRLSTALSFSWLLSEPSGLYKCTMSPKLQRLFDMGELFLTRHKGEATTSLAYATNTYGKAGNYAGTATIVPYVPSSTARYAFTALAIADMAVSAHYLSAIDKKLASHTEILLELQNDPIRKEYAKLQTLTRKLEKLVQKLDSRPLKKIQKRVKRLSRKVDKGMHLGNRYEISTDSIRQLLTDNTAAQAQRKFISIERLTAALDVFYRVHPILDFMFQYCRHDISLRFIKLQLEVLHSGATGEGLTSNQNGCLTSEAPSRLSKQDKLRAALRRMESYRETLKMFEDLSGCVKQFAERKQTGFLGAILSIERSALCHGKAYEKLLRGVQDINQWVGSWGVQLDAIKNIHDEQTVMLHWDADAKKVMLAV